MKYFIESFGELLVFTYRSDYQKRAQSLTPEEMMRRSWEKTGASLRHAIDWYEQESQETQEIESAEHSEGR